MYSLLIDPQLLNLHMTIYMPTLVIKCSHRISRSGQISKHSQSFNVFSDSCKDGYAFLAFIFFIIYMMFPLSALSN